MTETRTIDQFDRALLREVERNNLAPARILAERIGLSESAVMRRLRRLRQTGVIVADRSVIDPAVLGAPLLLHVLVSFERETLELLDTFIRTLRQYQEVKAAWYVTGEADFVIVLRLASMSAYDEFVREVFHNDPNIKSFRSIVAIREVIPAIL
ncbi:Lrp/AsnC family transcriptional regulator [Methylobacterium terricola]|uniref:Lrp/AsnC family transcriptional regulator n=2 Tax=Methylobacterium terricola TaxID=2583531 RepID=A0A5C4L8K0_9HYPH|nr:Lrp/AsnC family transcriptional regulator [Methylobacterium terricola]